jgi:hypothetical protein
VCCRKKFEQREREAKLFFKSDSDDGPRDATVERNGPSALPTVGASAVCDAHGVSPADTPHGCGETESLSGVLTVNGSGDVRLHYSESQGPEPVCGEASDALRYSERQGGEAAQEPRLPPADSRDEDAGRAVTQLKPRLIAPPSGVVDLDGGEPRCVGVARLMQRFMKHCAVKGPRHTKHNIELG